MPTATAAPGRRCSATGVTAFQPTLITAPEDDLVAALGEIPNDGIGPRVLGAHLEGPFIFAARARRAPRPPLGATPIASCSSACLQGPVAHVTLRRSAWARWS